MKGFGLGTFHIMPCVLGLAPMILYGTGLHGPLGCNTQRSESSSEMQSTLVDDEYFDNRSGSGRDSPKGRGPCLFEGALQTIES